MPAIEPLLVSELRLSHSENIVLNTASNTSSVAVPNKVELVDTLEYVDIPDFASVSSNTKQQVRYSTTETSSEIAEGTQYCDYTPTDDPKPNCLSPLHNNELARTASFLAPPRFDSSAASKPELRVVLPDEPFQQEQHTPQLDMGPLPQRTTLLQQPSSTLSDQHTGFQQDLTSMYDVYNQNMPPPPPKISVWEERPRLRSNRRALHPIQIPQPKQQPKRSPVKKKRRMKHPTALHESLVTENLPFLEEKDHVSAEECRYFLSIKTEPYLRQFLQRELNYKNIIRARFKHSFENDLKEEFDDYMAFLYARLSTGLDNDKFFKAQEDRTIMVERLEAFKNWLIIDAEERNALY